VVLGQLGGLGPQGKEDRLVVARHEVTRHNPAGGRPNEQRGESSERTGREEKSH